jgi:hypothetical protein
VHIFFANDRTAVACSINRLVALKVDVIVAVAVAASLAAREATARIPIVMQLARKSRQAIQYASSVTPVYLNGLAVDVAQLTQAIHERRVVLHHTGVLFRNGRENSDQPSSRRCDPMSELGQTQNSGRAIGKSALPSRAVIFSSARQVRKVPEADILAAYLRRSDIRH